jgi:BirA family transcriptional regulator, biotin operon repressor / biotin---[acetyl-CoA-carboxylase] ligase
LPKTAQRFEIPGRTVHWFESIGSTMTVAAELAREGAPHGTVVVADEQTAGIGRHGHSWHSQEGGLYVSIVLRLPETVPVLMLALGLAARDAIAKAGLQPDLRWPNDVLLNGRKCAGVLAQLEGSAVIAGIGINVNQTGFPDELEATSLLLAGATATRENVLMALVEAVDRYCSETPEEILRMFEASSSYARGRRVRVEQAALDQNVIEGVTQGLDKAGFLIVRQDNGQDTTILAGGVRPCC